MKFADLHLHTVFSDGTYTPEEIARRASSLGFSAISVVDHDTVMGIQKVIDAGQSYELEVLPGIELSTEYEDREIHILGYLIDYNSQSLLEKLAVLSKTRVERIYKITEKLKGLGINLEAQAVFDIAKQGNPGRLHIARAMKACGLVNTTGEAFYRYIGDKCDAYVSGFKLSPSERINLIRQA